VCACVRAPLPIAGARASLHVRAPTPTQMQMYEAVRDSAYATRTKLCKIQICQYVKMHARDQRGCVDCVGHTWVQNRNGNWTSESCPRLGLASGAGVDAECGFMNCSHSQLAGLARGLLRKVAEIEDQVRSCRRRHHCRPPSCACTRARALCCTMLQLCCNYAALCCTMLQLCCNYAALCCTMLQLCCTMLHYARDRS
jgi:hypothetical protein